MNLTKTLLPAVAFFLLFVTGTPGFASGSDIAVSLSAVPLTGCRVFDKRHDNCSDPVNLQPSPLSGDEVARRVPPETRIPLPGPEDLSYDLGNVFSRRQVDTEDLSTQVPRWLSMRFRPPTFHPPKPWMESVGNMLAEFQKTRGNAEAQERLLTQIQKEAPDIWEQVRTFLPEWVRNDYLYSSTWTPQKTGKPSKQANDGILQRPPFLLPGSAPDSGKDRKVYQASAPIYASLKEILAAESDFINYHEQAGANYLDVFPLPESAFVGTKPDGDPFLLYDVSYHQKPLPLWNLRFTLRQYLHREDGRWQMENHFLAGDMNHLRLRIFYDPIRTEDGSIIGYVKTEWLDVDIKGLPEGDEDREAGVRGDVGNIKKAAEKRKKSET